MNSVIFQRTEELPPSAGVFNLIDSNGQSLYVGAAENIKSEVGKALTANDLLNAQTAKIEMFEKNENDLLKFFNESIRRKKPLYNFSLAEQNLYPHFKITNEKFPRLLVTRRIAIDDAEYFGAFLPETGVRFMLGFINKMFRTRGCTVPIDGSFIVPCPEFYRKRCVAPCVENLCDEKNYLETVDFARLFLQNNQAEFNKIVSRKIQNSSDELNFEHAAKWRDFSQTVNNFWTDRERRYWLDDATDTFEIKQTTTQILIHLVTTRKRKTLGRRTFVFENRADFKSKEILEQTLLQFYAFHTPKEIFVPLDFPNRKFLEKLFSERAAGKKFKINILKKNVQKATIKRALRFTEFEFGQENLKPEKTLEEIQTEIQKEFALPKKPHRIEAFDVAHISGTNFVGAKSVWTAGKFVSKEYEFWFFDGKSELETLSLTIEKRFLSNKNPPDLILIDGGKSQLKAALKSLQARKISILSAVKPPQKHNEISFFLFADGNPKLFDKNSIAAQILLRLRDEAHTLANYIHRTKREMAHFYEISHALPGLQEKERQSLLKTFGSLTGLKNAPEVKLIDLLGAKNGRKIYKHLQKRQENFEPFIVPIRFDDPNGEAADLGRPLDLPEKLYRKLREETVGGGDRNRTDE